MKKTSKLAFTLVEALISIMILTIGFSALYYWFLAHGTMSARDRVRAESQMILSAELEQLVAMPGLAVDSQWSVKQGLDSFLLTRRVLDTTELRHMAEAADMRPDKANRFVLRPREGSLELQHYKKGVIDYTTVQYFVVGGVSHVSP